MSDTGNTFNVIDYGADYTGSSDSASDINDAIAAAQTAGGGIVLFPSGSYRVAETSLNLSSNITFYGYGATLSCETGSAALFSFVDEQNVRSYCGAFAAYFAMVSQSV
jgi:polygalacturonase